MINKLLFRQGIAYKEVFKKTKHSDKVISDLMLFCKLKKHDTDRDYFINIGRQEVLNFILNKLDIDLVKQNEMIKREKEINKEIIGESK